MFCFMILLFYCYAIYSLTFLSNNSEIINKDHDLLINFFVGMRHNFLFPLFLRHWQNNNEQHCRVRDSSIVHEILKVGCGVMAHFRIRGLLSRVPPGASNRTDCLQERGRTMLESRACATGARQRRARIFAADILHTFVVINSVIRKMYS